MNIVSIIERLLILQNNNNYISSSYLVIKMKHSSDLFVIFNVKYYFILIDTLILH